MPMLGDMLADARNSAAGFQHWLQTSDPGLAKALAAAAATCGTTPASYARSAVSDFARFAGEEDWATLISSLRQSEDPGILCLQAMVHWRLQASACDRHAHDHAEPQTRSGR